MKRSSWYPAKEDYFKKECNQILYQRNLQLIFNESEVYFKSEKEEGLLLIIEKPKRTWYEIWKKLRTI